jgi:uncharacterized protein YlxP (DUF503 family)
MIVGVLRLTFHIPHARSLKDKRRVVQKLRDRVRSRFDVSIAEVGAQNLHQRAVFTDRATELVTIGDDMYGDPDER